jgi:hypothetical protein
MISISIWGKTIKSTSQKRTGRRKIKRYHCGLSFITCFRLRRRYCCRVLFPNFRESRSRNLFSNRFLSCLPLEYGRTAGSGAAQFLSLSSIPGILPATGCSRRQKGSLFTKTSNRLRPDMSGSGWINMVSGRTNKSTGSPGTNGRADLV